MCPLFFSQRIAFSVKEILFLFLAGFLPYKLKEPAPTRPNGFLAIQQPVFNLVYKNYKSCFTLTSPCKKIIRTPNEELASIIYAEKELTFRNVSIVASSFVKSI